MPITVIATPNAADANSLISLDDYALYHSLRMPLDPPVVVTGDIAARNVIFATRVLSSMIQPHRSLRWDRNGKPYYYTSRAWTGAVATSTQSLAWGRTGMYDELGRVIALDSIPQRLKDATSELAGQLQNADTTLDNQVIAQGVTSVKAGSVSLTFKEMIDSKVLPDAVLALLVPSWLTDEQVEWAGHKLLFEAV